MPVLVVVGAQWGDEGKGKVTDLLCEQADMVVRYQGGNNAGHTVENSRGKFALHQLLDCLSWNAHNRRQFGRFAVFTALLYVEKR